MLHEHHAPKLHAMVEELASKQNIKKPPIFLGKNKKIFNAWATSLGSNYSAIMIGEKLLNAMTDEELKAVLAHELGHISNNHIPKKIGVSIGLQVGMNILLYQALKYLQKNHTKTYGYVNNELGNIVIHVTATGLLQFILLKLSRIHEKEADMTALATTQDPQSFIDAMQQLENEVNNTFDEFKNDYKLLEKRLKEINEQNLPYAKKLQAEAQQLYATIEKHIDAHINKENGSHPSLSERKRYGQEALERAQA